VFKRKKSPLKSTRLVEKKRKLRFARVLLALSVPIAFAIFVSWISDHEDLQLTMIEVKGNAGVDTSDIEEIVEHNLAGAYAGFFSRANRFLYPENKIEKEIHETFPEVKTVQLAAREKTVTVNVVERKPAYTWCKGMPKDRDKLGCYYMDEDGFVFAEAPRYSGNVFFAYYGIITEVDPITKTYMSGEQFIVTEQMYSALKQNGIHTVALVALDSGVRELYLTDGAKILFKDSQDGAKLVDALRIVKEETQLFNPLELEDLEYIDMRFGNKIYYKYVGKDVR
jgi:cell division septal protein FtsQ